MSRDEDQLPEDQFTLRLAAYDEAIAAGSSLDDLDETVQQLDPETVTRLRRAKGFLQFLERVRHRWDPAVPTVNPPVQASEAAATGDIADLPSDFGRFQILGELGRGGYGVVFLAFDPLLDRKVALKLPRPEALVTPELRRRFLREARSAAGLDHPNLATVYEAGEVGAVCYIAIGYCEGTNLAKWLAAHDGPVSPVTASRLVAALADAVHFAHGRGILHRDLKPANVLLEPRPLAAADSPDGVAGSEQSDDPDSAPANRAVRTADPTAEPLADGADLDQFVPKLTDFGLAKLQDRDVGDTRSGAVLGTPQYMAPEQAEGRLREMGPQTDVYGLGAILYELLTSQPPFCGKTPLEILGRVLSDEPALPRRLRPDVPRDLEAICLKCLEKEPRCRYPSAGALAEDLKRFLEGRTTRARPTGLWRSGLKWARRRPAVAALWLVSVAATLTLMGAAAWYATSLRHVRQEARRGNRLAEDRGQRIRQYAYADDMRRAYRAWQNGDIAQTLSLLERHRPRPDQEDLRSFVWHYLWRLCHSERLTLLGHTGEVYYVAYSPDGKMLATASQDGTVMVWDAATGEVQLALSGHEGEVTCAVFSPDGRRLVTTGEDRTARLWDAATGKELVTYAGHTDTVYAAAFTPDGTTLATAGRDKIVKLWNAATGDQRATLRGHTKAVESLAISPDGKTLATVSSDHTVRLWDLATGMERGVLHGHTRNVYSAAFSHDGQTLATAGEDREIIVWDVATGEQKGQLRGHTEVVQCVTFSPDGQLLASASKDGTVRLWDVATGEQRDVIQGHIGRVWWVAFSPDGKALATAGADGTVKLWSSDTSYGRPMTIRASGPVVCLRYASSGKLAAVDIAGNAAVLNGKRPPRENWRWPAVAWEWALAISSDGATLATRGRDLRLVGLSDIVTGRSLATIHVRTDVVQCAAFSPDGTLLATGCGAAPDESILQLWDSRTGRERAALRAHTEEIHCALFSPDGTTLATGSSDQTVKLWDVASATLSARFAAHKAGVLAVAFAPDGTTLATGSADATAKLWDLAAGQEFATLAGHTGPVQALTFSPDGRTLATGSEDGTIKLWNLATQQELITLDAHTGGVFCLTFSSDKMVLASGGSVSEGGGEVSLWRAASLNAPQ